MTLGGTNLVVPASEGDHGRTAEGIVARWH